MKHLISLPKVFFFFTILISQQALPFADEFDRLREHMNREIKKMEESFWGAPTHSTQKSISLPSWVGDTVSNLQAIHQTAQNISRDVQKAMISLSQDSSRFDNTKEKELKHEIAQLEERRTALNGLLKSMKKPKTQGTKILGKTHQGFDISTKNENNELVIVLSAPGFEEKDLSIKIKKDDRRLTVSGSKEEKDSSSGKSEKVKHHEQLSMVQSINGMKRQLSYEDGNLKATVDLPKNIDYDNFKTTFENEMLTIAFPIKEK